MLKSIVSMTWILPVILAAPSVRRSTKEANLFVKFDKTTLETEITVMDVSSQLLGQICNTLLNSGPFVDFPISTNLDQNGAGNVTLGTDTYVVHELAEFSGGITCTRMYNNLDSVVKCLIKLVPINTIPPAATSNLQDLEFKLTNTSEGRADCNLWTKGVVRIGDGDPHQNYLHTQLSENINCGAAAQCEVSRESARTYAVNFSWGGSFGGWTSAGFAVEQSTTTGEAYGCTALSYQTVCIWYSNAHTAYSVQTREHNQCYGDQWGERYVLVSPNIHNVGGSYYCVVGTCRFQSANWMQRDGRAGGP
ncbi:hypothetical protein BKA64DRAFT_623698 [Cadophora sp. MPI-SDFR-AT-0126]|nr:hypothetical protein BKA64DRAFT_623698 [Leotiomycetes sp. MPI-SDFR-AT-0126]